MKLYVKDIVREPNDTLYTFLEKVLRLNIDSYYKGSSFETYSDVECTDKQCNSGKYRSFDDIVSISKTYFRVSDKAVAKVLRKFLEKDSEHLFVLCDTAKSWVFHRGIHKSEVLKYCAAYNKSYQKTEKTLDGKYSFDDIIILMGLTKEDIKINN